MLVTLSGIVMLVRPVQPLNADSPMLVTLSGIVMLLRLLQPENVLFRAVIPSGIIRFSTNFPFKYRLCA